MRDFKKGNKFGNKSSFGARKPGRPSFGAPYQRDTKPGRSFGKSAERPTFYSATCSTCGQSCEVPFRPSEDRPVFCRNCYDKEEGTGKNARFEKRPVGRFNSASAPDPRIAVMEKQIESLTRKVEKLFSIVQSTGHVAEASNEESEYMVRSSFTPKKFSKKKGLKKVVKKKRK